MKKKQSKWLGVFGALLLCLIYFVLGTIYEVASAKSIYKCEMSVVTTNDGNFYMVKNGKFQSAILRFGADGTINGTYIEDNTNFLSSEKMSFASVMTTVDNNVYFLREYINSETNCRVRYDVLKLYVEDGKLKATNLYTKVGENLPQIWSINIENDQLFLASVYSDNRTVQIDQFDIIDKGEALFLRASQKYINSDDEPIIKEFENEDLFQKKHQYLFNLFNTDITNIRGKYISEKINIALHIRRGDYIGYNGGCFYYSDEVYLNKVKELCKIIKTNNIRLIICTNDSELNKDVYLSEYPDTVFSKESFTTDHQLMAACDYIIGAPSSFSMWASFLGQTPCMHIYKPDAELTKNDFVIFESSPVSAF